MSHYIFLLNSMKDNGTGNPGDFVDPRRNGRDFVQQLVISTALGFSAFFTFCVIRPRWPHFYYGRKLRDKNAGSTLPELPPGLLSWIPKLWRISDKEVLAAAGLDAYVFLSFFKMAAKFLLISTILAGVILAPIHANFGPHSIFAKSKTLHRRDLQTPLDDKPPKEPPINENYLWAHLVFVYIFTGLVFYFVKDQTEDVVHVRQEYLGNQSTVTDRTIKLSGIPEGLRSEGILKEYIEKLKIGGVEKVTLCRNWRELDDLMEKRRCTLRMLEEAHTVNNYGGKLQRNLETLPFIQPEPPYPVPGMTPDDEVAPLLTHGSPRGYLSGRPQITVRKRWYHLTGKKVDAIEYLTMKLQNLDDKITEARRKEYRPMPLAFITMESVPAAQVAIQALLDPTPGVMIARQAPAPTDIVWENTYLSRRARSIRHWIIRTSVTLLSVFWLIPVAALAVLWNMTEIRRTIPSLADFLEENPMLMSLVQNFLPTLVLTLLNVAIPYLYDWLSTYQGLLSQADVELSVISKNFFFTFFNLFFAFTVFGTAFTFHSFWEHVRDGLMNTTKIAYLLAQSLEGLGPFYVNLIVLQGLGMFPFRLLQIGSVLLYPITKYGAKTPRDFDELVQPPIFKYGFYLPQPILIFIICIVYSVLERGVYLLFFGLLYFVLGYFTYKYQLLYAMEHTQHSTGRAWPMIVHRIQLGLVVFQVSMAGWLALKSAYTRAGLILPLLAFTVWSVRYYNQEYLPSNKYIALKSVRDHANTGPVREAGAEQTLDEEREAGLEFMNPSLISP
ncbi:DUF221-domain-containing protein [Ascodesmis nigricans]|uniref:DUF221-domain-containing protein n=1 Tax=Ascodesmis nigricans TaxID=341454 RepID=A0A4S2N8D7_9PEZI|nr:DUF221-domain-containing protein [Ascodesmis nigricans]